MKEDKLQIEHNVNVQEGLTDSGNSISLVLITLLPKNLYMRNDVTKSKWCSIEYIQVYEKDSCPNSRFIFAVSSNLYHAWLTLPLEVILSLWASIQGSIRSKTFSAPIMLPLDSTLNGFRADNSGWSLIPMMSPPFQHVVLKAHSVCQLDLR